MQPPQTYVRLFRPWDSNYSASIPASSQIAQEESPVQKEDLSFYNQETSDLKAENYSLSGSESDPECASSSSSSSKSFNSEENFTNNPQLTTSSTSSPTAANQSPQVPYAHPHFFGSLESHASHIPSHYQHTAQMMPATSSSNFHYAAAAAANTLHPVPSTSSFAAAATAAAAYALDPYALSLLEQECARVMAEDARLKTANSRKQRPKKFLCPYCPNAFSNKGQLTGHIRIHTGERPYLCNFKDCKKAFTRNEELTRHKRIHSGDRPFPCHVCGKKFGRRDHLKKHMRTHMPQERQFGPAYLMYPYFYGL